MTREEAIAFFKDMNECTYGNLEAVDMAIKALEQEPCEDAISRQAVDELSKELVHTTRDKADFLCNFWEGLSKLPPVNPKQETVTEFADRCGECGREKVPEKIRAEIEQIELLAAYTRGDIKSMVLEIIDKYRESEDKDTQKEDVRPVVRGKWIKDEVQNHIEIKYHCSKCGYGAWGETEKTNYCPNCGAKMEDKE